MIRLLSLFTGVGAFDLGLERVGMTPIGQCEIDPFRRSVLARHWPTVPRHDDVRTVVEWWASEPRPHVDVIAGGFPCQDISHASPTRTGLAGERSGLWFPMLRVIDAVRPRAVIVENSTALRSNGLGLVIGGLADIGYRVEWAPISACAVGGPHVRRRLFIVAHANSVDGSQRLGCRFDGPAAVQPASHGAGTWDRKDFRVATTATTHGMADGATGRLDAARVAAAGDAVVVPVAELIGRHAVRLLLGGDQGNDQGAPRDVH